MVPLVILPEECGTRSFTTQNTSVCWLFMSTTSKLLVQRKTWQKHGKRSVMPSTLASPNPIAGILDATTKSSTTSNSQRKHTAHPSSHVFEAKTAAVCQQHRVNDYWEHDAQAKTWTRHHLQPRKKWSSLILGVRGETCSKGIWEAYVKLFLMKALLSKVVRVFKSSMPLMTRALCLTTWRKNRSSCQRVLDWKDCFYLRREAKHWVFCYG